MARAQAPVVDFYDRHPIAEGSVLAALRRRGRLAGPIELEDLREWDHDHYGGRGAVLALIRRAEIGRGSVVLDVCAGLGGPARFIAHRAGARVVGLDLTHSRCAAGRRLSAMVGLSERVRMVNGDAQAMPFRPRAFTAVVSQEGLLHVPDKAAALAECARVLAPGGRIAFTDWVATPRLADGERARLAAWMAAVNLESLQGYRGLLGRAGFAGVEAEDVTGEWLPILRERTRMFRALGESAAAPAGHARRDEYVQLHAFLVGLVEAGKLGGARFSGRGDRGIS